MALVPVFMLAVLTTMRDNFDRLPHAPEHYYDDDATFGLSLVIFVAACALVAASIVAIVYVGNLLLAG